MKEKGSGLKNSLIMAQLIALFISGNNALAAKQVVDPTISIRQEYNDNVLFSSQNATDDLITTASPEIYLARETERYKTSFDGRLDFLKYSDNSDLNTVDQSYQGDLAYLFTPKLSMQIGLKYLKDSRSDRDIDTSGIILGTSTRENKDLNSSLQYTMSEKSAGSVGYSYGRSDNEDPAQSDLSSHNWSASYSRDLSDYWLNTVGIANFGLGLYDYDTSNIDSYSLTFGIQKKITELYIVDFHIGPRYTVSHFDNISSDSKNWGIKADISLTHEGEKSKTSISLSNDVNSGTTTYVGTSNKTSLAGKIAYRLSEELFVNLRLSYHLNKTDSGKLSLSRIDEKTINISPNIRYQINHDLSVTGSYTYSKVKNDVLATRTERNLLFVKLNWRWPLKD